jgi:Uncharacterised nucleotidyltransferase
MTVLADTVGADLLARIVAGHPVAWSGVPSAEALTARARAHGVESLVAARLRDDVEAPQALREGVAGLEAAAVAVSLVRDFELQRVLRGLGIQGLEVLVVKGVALGHSVYAHPHLRPAVDTDLLVRHEALPAVTGALADLGYRPSDRASSGELVSHQRAFERRTRGDVEHVLDVHWRLSNPQVFAAAFDADAAFGTAVDLHGLGPHARTLAPAEALLLCAIHRLAHHQDHERLIWLVDIDLLARRTSADEWKVVLQLAQRRRMRTILGDALRRTRELLETPVPAFVDTALRQAGEDEPSAVYVSAPQGKLQVLKSDLRELPGWTARVRLVREHVFPPPAFVLKRYGVTRRSWLPALYAHRLATGMWKWLRAR